MTDKEVMQMALDAFERDSETGLMNAMETLRAALAQPEPKAQYSDIVSDGGLDPRNKRKWVGLTRDQVSEIWVKGGYEFDPMHAVQTFARAVEAKLKEKNAKT